MDDDLELHPPPLRPPLHNSSAPRDEEPDVELEKLKKWQQERMERRLRGEYESMLLHLGELVLEHHPDCEIGLNAIYRFRPTYIHLYACRLSVLRVPRERAHHSWIGS